MIHIDLETHSRVDLKACGAYRYAMDPSTGLYVMSYQFHDEEEVYSWVPGTRTPFPVRVIEHIKRGGIIKAWNAQFERLMFWYVICPDYDVPEPAIEQFQCTAAQARAHALPGKLGDCARAMGRKQQKLTEGTRLINTYCAQNVPWEDIPGEDKHLMVHYCEQDVRTEAGIEEPLRDLTDHEWAEYHLNERICDAGVPLDVDMIREAADYADVLRQDADGHIAVLTDGAVKTARQRKTRDAWVLPQLNDELIKHLHVYKKGEKKITFDQDHRDALANDPDCPEPVLRYLELVDEAGGASLRKYKAMANREIDGQLYGALMFNGAGQTGRFSSTGIQVHNLKRASLEDPEAMIRDLMDGYELPDPSATLGQLVRSTIYRPEGLSWADWSNIEGRVAPWLANTPDGEVKLDVFRSGGDPYINNAARTFGVARDDVDKEQRQAGKVQELALQFLGGVGALKLMARGYGLHLTQAMAERMRDAWRAENPWAMTFGHALERAAIKAVMEPGEWQEVGRVAYAFDGHCWLWCRLPCGRLLAYFQPNLEWGKTPWGEEVLQVTCTWGAAKAKVGEPWPRRHMYGGRWLENITQATAASLLRYSIEQCDKEGVPVILHVHDEIISEGGYQEDLERIMQMAPAWAEGLPIAVEGDSGQRYGK
jgi:DNA polymerase